MRRMAEYQGRTPVGSPIFPPANRQTGRLYSNAAQVWENGAGCHSPNDDKEWDTMDEEVKIDANTAVEHIGLPTPTAQRAHVRRVFIRAVEQRPFLTAGSLGALYYPICAGTRLLPTVRTGVLRIRKWSGGAPAAPARRSLD